MKMFQRKKRSRKSWWNIVYDTEAAVKSVLEKTRIQTNWNCRSANKRYVLKIMKICRRPPIVQKTWGIDDSFKSPLSPHKLKD
jgi:dTDP-D-glucose 4,6-dehydratase